MGSASGKRIGLPGAASIQQARRLQGEFPMQSTLPGMQPRQRPQADPARGLPSGLQEELNEKRSRGRARGLSLLRVHHVCRHHRHRCDRCRYPGPLESLTAPRDDAMKLPLIHLLLLSAVALGSAVPGPAQSLGSRGVMTAGTMDTGVWLSSGQPDQSPSRRFPAPGGVAVSLLVVTALTLVGVLPGKRRSLRRRIGSLRISPQSLHDRSGSGLPGAGSGRLQPGSQSRRSASGPGMTLRSAEPYLLHGKYPQQQLDAV